MRIRPSGARRLKAFSICLAAIAVFVAKGSGQVIPDSFNPNASSPYLPKVRRVVVQTDGMILLGGEFTTLAPNGGAVVTRNNLARVHSDGSLDPTFDPNPNGHVNVIALQSDGKILVGGDFTSIGGQQRNRLARLDPVTGMADSFDPNLDAEVYALAFQADGKIVAGGLFANAGGLTRNHIARLDSVTGAPDTFDPNAQNSVTCLAIQPDGKILAGGAFAGTNSIGGAARNFIARLDPVTGQADAFNPNANSVLWTLCLQGDGKILVGGLFTSVGGASRNYIARLDPNTGIADSFNPNASDFVTSIVIQGDGRILVGGAFDHDVGPISIGGQLRNCFARLDPDTGLADSYNADVNYVVGSIAEQADGKIIIAGLFTSVGGVSRGCIARLPGDGWLPTSITTGGGDVLIHFGAVAGITYRLERRSALTDSTWDVVPNVEDQTPSNGGPAFFVDPNAISLGQAFYRVRTVP